LIDLKVHNKLAPKKGRVLITEPFVDDDYFGRTVILLCEHNEEGSFGFVLNKYIDVEVDELSDFDPSNLKISKGGPVGNKHLYFIHTMGHESDSNRIEGSVHVIGDIYSGGTFEQIVQLAKLGLIKKKTIRFFIGYSGWTTNQLESELKTNAWLVSDIIDTDSIMNTNNSTIWEDYMTLQGGKYKAFAHFPKNPHLN
jgi:putative transcriptional regulator